MNKKIVLVLFLSLVINYLYADELLISAQVITDGTDLVSKPIETASYSGRVYQNSKVIVLKRTSWKDEVNEAIDYWYYVRKGNVKGWIFGRNLVLLAVKEDIELLKVDEEFKNPIFKPYNLTQFTDNPFNNDFTIPPLEISNVNEIKSNYGKELTVEINNVENRYDKNIIDTFYHLSNDYIEISYKKSKSEKLVLIRYCIKGLSILNKDIAELNSKEELTSSLGEPQSESFYNGDDIYFYLDDNDLSINFYFRDNKLKEVVIWYFEG